MVRKAKGGGALGTALRKDKNKGNLKKQEYIKQHGAENLKEGEKGKQKLHSEVERDPVKDFLYSAELKQQKFEAVKQRKLVTTDSLGTQQVIDLSTGLLDGPSDELKKEALREMEHLRIPRRPAWDGKRAGRDQRLLENTVYLDWRRNLSALEEKYRFVHVTPYEKNIEIWRQLWVVIEKSDILVQIVDCRDPLFFRCLDLENYVKEVGKNKINFLLLNKADLLGEEIRTLWSAYFNKHNVKHIFFSAKDQQSKIDQDMVEYVPVDFSGILNTPKIADRGTLKQILKSIVSDFKQKVPQTEEATPESVKPKPAPATVAKEEEMDAPKKSQAVSAALATHTHKAVVQEAPKVVGPAETEPTAPSKPRLRIVREVNPNEIKDKPIVNLWSAVGQMVVDGIENPKFADDCSCDDCDEPEHNHEHNHEHKETKESEAPKDPKEVVAEEEEDSDEEGEEEEDEEEEDIYTKLGVDKNNLNSTPFYGKKNESEVVIGMIGFPNVGKSSVINVLCNKKLVGVGARPGKTKNFQTIFLEKELLLCDCPGLVFPSIVHSKTQMVTRLPHPDLQQCHPTRQRERLRRPS